MISIRFFTFSKKVNSTARPDLTSATSFNCTLKSTCSILSPEITLDTGSANAPRFNYCYIEEFDRFYFVSNWTWANGLWSASLTVDALASWKNTIGASTQYILRSASAYNGKVLDTLYPTLADSYERHVDIDLFGVDEISDGCFILGIINGHHYVDALECGSVSYYALSTGGMATLKTKLFDNTIWESLIKDFIDPMQYIASVNWIPFNTGNVSTGATNLDIGNATFMNAVPIVDKDRCIVTKQTTLSIPKHTQAKTRGEYLNMSPYMRYTLYIEPFGTIALDNISLLGVDNIKLVAKTDVISGKSVLRGYIMQGEEVTSNMVFEAIANVGVPIELAQRTSWTSADMFGVAGSTASTMALAGTGNAGGALVGGIGFIGSVTNGFKENVRSQGANGSFLLYNVPAMLRATQQTLVDENLDHRGRPLCSDRLISSLSGYILCSDVELAIAGTSDECDTIKSYMEGGFYYE